jgi:hypothetical protein
MSQVYSSFKPEIAILTILVIFLSLWMPILINHSGMTDFRYLHGEEIISIHDTCCNLTLIKWESSHFGGRQEKANKWT